MFTQKLKQSLYIFLGSLALILGVIGVFLPILPTTPFLLLASFFYVRSSKRLYQWLITHKVFGTYIYNYITYHAVTRNTKIGAIAFLWLTLGISFFISSSLHLRIFLGVVGIAVSIHLIMLKTLSLEIKKETL